MAKLSYTEYINGSPSSFNDANAPQAISKISPTSTSSSDITIASKKYSYCFGIDSIEFSHINVEDAMCFISDEIDVGILSDDEYIQLIADYNAGDNGSVEFYIIDGSTAKEILPIGTDVVINEKIFFGLRTRFSIDNTKSIIVKKDGNIVDISLDTAIEQNDTGYTVSYNPLDAHNIKTTNSSIMVKVIIRTYDKNARPPFVKSLAIKKYGRTSLWNDSTIK